MTFQEQIAALLMEANVPDDKKASVKAALDPMFEAMTRTFHQYDTDINDLKGKVRATEGIKPEEYAALETKVKELTDELGGKTAAHDKVKKDYDTAVTQLGALKGQLTSATLEKEVRKAMGAFKIAPDAVDEVYSIITGKVKQKEDGSFVIPHVTKVKDAAGTEVETAIESPVSAYMEKYWATSPFAKRVLLADYSTGGGAGGTKGGPGTGSKPWKEMSLSEQTAAFKSDPVAAQAQIDAASAAK
jgi:hypothetical protein